MAIDRLSLLGFAFAGADLLLELDGDGRVTLAVGSGPAAGMAAESFTGAGLADRFCRHSRRLLRCALDTLKPGKRADGLDLMIDCGDGVARKVHVQLVMLPQLAPAVSCSVRYDGPAAPLREAATPILTADGFLDRAATLLTGAGGEAAPDLAVAFVDLDGLATAQASPTALARIEAALQDASFGGDAAARVAGDRFAVLRPGADAYDLGGQLQAIARTEGLALTVRAAQAPSNSAFDPLAALRAIRFAIEACLKTPAPARPEAAFTDGLRRTVKDANAFTAMVAARRFALAYQPVVDLATETVQHHEALSRFAGEASPEGAIRMAEELALVAPFDLAVLEKALAKLRQPGFSRLSVAINASGASLADDRFVDAVLAMTANSPDDRRRLMVEVTETAALADLDAANRRLAALRGAGIKVCIDDFGAGSASFDYLRGLSVDVCKIDGRFVREVDSSERCRTLIAHLVELCGSLGMATIGEMVETRRQATVLKELGVTHGQGWLFGRPEAEPRFEVSAPKSARRRGVVEAWG